MRKNLKRLPRLKSLDLGPPLGGFCVLMGPWNGVSLEGSSVRLAFRGDVLRGWLDDDRDEDFHHGVALFLGDGWRSDDMAHAVVIGALVQGEDFACFDVLEGFVVEFGIGLLIVIDEVIAKIIAAFEVDLLEASVVHPVR